MDHFLHLLFSDIKSQHCLCFLIRGVNSTDMVRIIVQNIWTTEIYFHFLLRAYGVHVQSINTSKIRSSTKIMLGGGEWLKWEDVRTMFCE
jgi:hypothetical protein